MTQELPTSLKSAMQAVLADCAKAEGPTPELRVRFGREHLADFDSDYGDIFPRLLARIPVDRWTMYIRLPGRIEFRSLQFEGGEPETFMRVALAEAVQESVIESHDNVWPRCPVHGNHPLWPEEWEGVATWACPDGHSYRIEIGLSFS